MSQNVDSIIIRMYNTGSVGDCFLLLFQKNEITTFTMLIDCGGYKTRKDIISKCVEDIRHSIIDDSIDLVVITHEHEDHVSGFNQSRAIFDQITFKQVWMSWAENDLDPIAIQLLKEKRKKIIALRSILSQNLSKIKRHIQSKPSQFNYYESLKLRKNNFNSAIAALDFEIGNSKIHKGIRLRIQDAMKYVKSKSKIKSRSKIYKYPGEVIKDMQGAEGIKFYILGPPYDSDFGGIKNKMQDDEMYSQRNRLGLNFNDFYFNAIANISNSDIPLKSPFSSKYQIESKADLGFIKNNYKEIKWRQIEYDWLDTAGDLSISITDYVNNTSLAFAIEFESSNRVLLFPADAQSGNWISWHDNLVKEKLKKNGGKDAAELLSNTVFYKVGHHGSHNGTASKSGLEIFNHDNNIVAFLPLVQDRIPSQWGGALNFPAKELYRRLIEKTKGVVYRTDIGLVLDKKAVALRKSNFTNKELNQMKKASNNPLYHEWCIKG